MTAHISSDSSFSLEQFYQLLAEPQAPEFVAQVLRDITERQHSPDFNVEHRTASLNNLNEALMDNNPPKAVLEWANSTDHEGAILLKKAVRFNQYHPDHYPSLYDHLVETAQRLPKDPELRMAGLLHDIGKMATFEMRLGKGFFPSHHKISCQIAELFLAGYSGNIDRVLKPVLCHQPNYTPEWGAKAVKRYQRKAAPYLDETFAVLLADTLARPISSDLSWYDQLAIIMGAKNWRSELSQKHHS